MYLYVKGIEHKANSPEPTTFGVGASCYPQHLSSSTARGSRLDLKPWCLGLTLRDSDLIDLGAVLGFLKSYQVALMFSQVGEALREKL